VHCLQWCLSKGHIFYGEGVKQLKIMFSRGRPDPERLTELQMFWNFNQMSHALQQFYDNP
jgi:hypothetical protein